MFLVCDVIVRYEVHLPSIAERMISISVPSCPSCVKASISYHNHIVVLSSLLSLSASQCKRLLPVWFVQVIPALLQTDQMFLLSVDPAKLKPVFSLWFAPAGGSQLSEPMASNMVVKADLKKKKIYFGNTFIEGDFWACVVNVVKIVLKWFYSFRLNKYPRIVHMSHFIHPLEVFLLTYSSVFFNTGAI